jgi:hypothetical protein
MKMIQYLRENYITMKGKYLKHDDGQLRTAEEWKTFLENINL